MSILKQSYAIVESMKNFWLVKQEPSSYSWSDFTKDGGTSWTGVRNYAARNNLRRMRKGDQVLFYHSGGPSRTGSRATPQEETKAVVGIAKVAREAYADPTAKGEDWSTVDFIPVRRLRWPVTLRQIKEKPRLKKMKLVRQSRLSVMPLTAQEFRLVLDMGA